MENIFRVMVGQGRKTGKDWVPLTLWWLSVLSLPLNELIIGNGIYVMISGSSVIGG